MTEDSSDLIVPLSQLGSGGAAHQQDARGWAVLAANEVPTGKVQDLLIDTRTAEVHAFVVEVASSSGLGSSSFRVLIPAEQARVEPGSRRVHIDSLSWDQVALLPRHGESPRPRPGDDDTVIVDAPAVVPPAVADEVRMTLFGEQLDIRTETVDAGEVVVAKRVEVEEVRRVVPTMREDVVIERRPLPPGVGFEPRVEGDVTYVPLVQEELVIEKRLVAREELVIRKRQLTEDRVVEETLRREVADINQPDAPRSPE